MCITSLGHNGYNSLMYKPACVGIRAVLLGLGLTLGCAAALADTATVKFTGIEGELRDNARAFLSLLKKATEPSAAQISRWHRLAGSEISRSLQPFGYYNVTVESDLSETSSGNWNATYHVTPGPRSRWRQVEVNVRGEGEADEFIKSLLRDSTVRRDAFVDHQKYTQFKRAWIVELYDQGYLDARFEKANFSVDAEVNRADVTWLVNTGERYRFGEVKIDQDILNTALVDRYHAIAEGDVFDTNRLIDLQLKLNNSNYFESVALDIQKDQAQNGHIPVVFNTVARKRRRYDLGIGFGTDTGPRVSAGIESRRVNKRGHRYRLNGRASTIESAVQFEYIIPIKDVSKDRWRIYAQAQQAEVGDADATAYSLGAAREDSWLGMRRRLFVNAESSDFAFGDEPSRTVTLVYPGITLSFDRLDDPQFVRRGYSLAATLQGGADALGSQTDFASLQLTARGILPLGSRGRLLVATDAKILEAGDFSALPPSQRFFLGGDRSVRGYAFQSISPENAAGDDIGGSRSLSFSIETDYQVSGNWGLAAFFDGGDVSDGTPSSFDKGVGLGIRYRSPVGMIRVDLAHPLDDPDNNFRLHLSIGPDL